MNSLEAYRIQYLPLLGHFCTRRFKEFDSNASQGTDTAGISSQSHYPWLLQAWKMTSSLKCLGQEALCSLVLNFKSHLASLGKPHFLQLQNDADLMAREHIKPNKQTYTDKTDKGVRFQLQAQCCCEAGLCCRNSSWRQHALQTHPGLRCSSPPLVPYFLNKWYKIS